MGLYLDYTPQVWGITGNLGGGKSLSAVYLAVNAMRDGYFVCSNITLDIDYICQNYGKHLRSLYQHISLDDLSFDPFKIPCGSPRGSRGGKRVLVILDECAEWVDQYSSAKDPRIARLWSWIRHSSKRSQDVILVVQRLEYLNKVLRLLVSKWVIVDDLKIWRIPILKIRLPFMGGFVMQRVFDKLGNMIMSPRFISKSVWGRCYNTAECLNSDGATYNVEYKVPRPSLSIPLSFWFFWISSIICCAWLFVSSGARLRAPEGAERLRALGNVCISAQTNRTELLNGLENLHSRLPVEPRGQGIPR